MIQILVQYLNGRSLATGPLGKKYVQQMLLLGTTGTVGTYCKLRMVY